MLVPHFLRTEGSTHPHGLSQPQPRLSWGLATRDPAQRQTAYQIQVAASERDLREGAPLLWDSGKIPSAETSHIPFEGTALRSRQRCFWHVRVWDANDAVSPYSDPAMWSMGLLEAADWRAAWVGNTAVSPPLPGDSRVETLRNAPWHRFNGEDLQESGTQLRYDFHWDAQKCRGPQLWLSSTNPVELTVNGKKPDTNAGQSAPLREVAAWRLDALLHDGRNPIEMRIRPLEGPAYLRGALLWEEVSGKPHFAPVDASWFDGPGTRAATVTNGLEIAHPRDLQACPLFVKEFTCAEIPERAALYISALGIHEVTLNGEAISADLFRPGWTDYARRLHYDAYDVAPLIRKGANALRVTLAGGWCLGYLGWEFAHEVYARQSAFILQLELSDATGLRRICSDETWRTGFGNLLRADLYHGCRYVHGRVSQRWDAFVGGSRAWPQASVIPVKRPVLAHQAYEPARRIAELPPVSIAASRHGAWIVDFGQNIAGWAELLITPDCGDVVTLRYAEVLSEDQELFTRSLRSACAEDVFHGRVDEAVWFAPQFTFHGFRYVEIAGYGGQPESGAIRAVLCSSDLRSSSEFDCGVPALNRLVENTRWSQRGNFLEVPTDCPQRDERLGWLGDAQVFAGAAMFNMDCEAFFEKWVNDLRDAQSEAGAFPDVAPRATYPKDGAPAWGDAGVIIPWKMYCCYGDAGVLRRHYDGMRRWVDFIHEGNPDLLRVKRVGANYGDWVSQDARTPKELVATAYFSYVTKLLARIAAVCGDRASAAHYCQLARAIDQAFRTRFVDAQGALIPGTQTAYALAVNFRLLTPAQMQAVRAPFENALAERDHLLSTGFLGTPALLPALDAAGLAHRAVDLLLSDRCPSWLYPITHGATTIWERWDARTKDGSFFDDEMLSFNHYAFGAVCEWIYRRIGGISYDPGAPGFRHIRITPLLSERIGRARFQYDSIRGPIGVRWERSGGSVQIEVSTPPNTRCTAALPLNPGSLLLNGEIASARSPDAGQRIDTGACGVEVHLEPGYHVFEGEIGEAGDVWRPFTDFADVEDIETGLDSQP
ncbi:MAG: family 78 glycoside hydrolase catalytic domain [Candidatus Hydrogenedentes bacterium]|nr:family 78 glycoside hydrolase catalytic domain [Candidatus Hydrogenedentota bacterium]